VTDYLRKTLDKEVPREVQPDDARVGADGVARIAHKELLAMVHELPNGQRTVFNMFVIENYSHREIGELLGITENNSRWYLNDARRRLKEKIKFHQ
jgi:RNA polymerase sigma-70 factor (ECF subfamily)